MVGTETVTQNKHIYWYFLWLYAAWIAYVAYVFPGLSALEGLPGEIVLEAARIIIFLAPLLLLRWFTGLPTLASLGLTNRVGKGVLLGLFLGAVYALIALPLTIYFKNKSPSGVPIWTALTLAVIVEEIIFRGLLVGYLSRYNKWTAVIVSSILFVLIHYPGWWLLKPEYTALDWIMSSGNIFILGVILALVYLRTRLLWACVVIHSVNNLIAI